MVFSEINLAYSETRNRSLFKCSGMDTEDTKMGETIVNGEAGSSAVAGPEADKPGDRMFTLKKWNAVAMWSWDVECDTCAICRQVRSTLLKGCLPNKVDSRVNYQPVKKKLRKLTGHSGFCRSG